MRVDRGQVAESLEVTVTACWVQKEINGGLQLRGGWRVIARSAGLLILKDSILGKPHLSKI